MKFLIVPDGHRSVEEKGEKVDDEGVPHEVEGDGRPEDMAADEEIVRRERVGDDVGQRKDRVEDEEETYLKVVLQEVQDPRHD